MVGQFALALAITAPIILFANLELRTVQATDARGDYRFNEYFGVRLLTTILALLAIAAVLLIADYSREVAIIIMLVGIVKKNGIMMVDFAIERRRVGVSADARLLDEATTWNMEPLGVAYCTAKRRAEDVPYFLREPVVIRGLEAKVDHKALGAVAISIHAQASDRWRIWTESKSHLRAPGIVFLWEGCPVMQTTNEATGLG
jgi:hypothetical protein